MFRQLRFESLILKVWKLSTFPKYLQFPFQNSVRVFREFFTCFFLGIGVFFSCFFSLEKFKITHSLDWKVCFFFLVVKKEKQNFYSLTRFLSKSCKNQIFPIKKRYLWSTTTITIHDKNFRGSKESDYQLYFWILLSVTHRQDKY